MTVDEILHEVALLGRGLVEVTGGEPLAQKDTPGLLSELCQAGYEVMLETSGAFPIENLDDRVRIVMDVKCPGSGMMEKMRFENFDHLTARHCELKFVVGSKNDFDWTVDLCESRRLAERAELLVSPVYGAVSPRDLAEWVLGTHIRLRLQIQLHKVIWPDTEAEV